MKNKPYTLFLQFETFEDLWNWSRKNLSEDLALYKGFTLDPEFKGIGRVPANSVIVRKNDDPLRQDYKLQAELVPKKVGAL